MFVYLSRHPETNVLSVKGIGTSAGDNQMLMRRSDAVIDLADLNFTKNRWPEGLNYSSDASQLIITRRAALEALRNFGLLLRDRAESDLARL